LFVEALEISFVIIKETREILKRIGGQRLGDHKFGPQPNLNF